MSSASQILNNFITYIINPAMLLLFATAFFVFMWGIVQFMWTLNQGEVENSGKDHMIYGIIGMVIMASTYTIIGMIDTTFNLNATNPDMSKIDNTAISPSLFGNP